MVKYSAMYLISNELALTTLNGGICILGDYLVNVNQESQIRKAIADNATHAVVGFFSALVLILETSHRVSGIERISLIAISVFVSSFIDIDHFLVAKSMHLSRAVNIDRRPFLHFTTIPLASMILIVPLDQLFQSPRLSLWLSVFTCAFLCHHTRDATRRGFTMWPFGTTKPLPYALYIALVMATPFLLNKWLSITTTSGHHRYRTLEVLTV